MGFDAPERTAVRPDSAGLTGVRLHTRMPVTPAWIARHIVPAARALGQQGAPGVQMRRGWLHGPHFDVRALDAAGVPGGAIDWQSVAARLEAVQPPYLPLRAHGAVEVIAPDDPALRSREPRLDALRHVVGGAPARPPSRRCAASPRTRTTNTAPTRDCRTSSPSPRTPPIR